MALTKVKLIADGVIVQSNLDASHGITTADIGEGSNLYYTDARARAAVSVSGNALSYNSSTGVITSNFEESPTFTGQVGIGTDSPDELLHLQNTSQNSYLYMSGGGSLGETYGGFVRGYGVSGQGGHLELGVVDAGAKRIGITIQEQGNQIEFDTAGTERMRIDSSGKILLNNSSYNFIGTNTSDGSNTQRIYIGAGNDATATQGGLISVYGNEHASTSEQGQVSLIAGRKSTGNIKFWTGETTTIERMRITSAGNVGIATTNPSQALDVNGYIKATNAGAGYVQGVFVAHSSTSDSPSYRGQGYFTYNEDYDVSWFMGTPYTNGDFFCINRQHSTTSFDTAASYIGNTNTDNFLSITNTGRVGISAIDPVKTLDVRGQLAISNNASSYWYMDRNDSTGNFEILTDGNSSVFNINTSGNVGIGTTTITNPYGQTNFTDLNINGVWGGVISFKLGGTEKGWIGQRSSGNQDMVLGASSGQGLLFYTNGTNERMQITSGGDVILKSGASNTGASLIFNELSIPAWSIGNPNGANGYFAIIDEYNSAERMRITYGGEVLIRRAVYTDTTFSLQVGDGASDSYRPIRCEVASTSTRTQIAFYNPSGNIGTISTAASSTSYNTSSDYRLKENVVEMTGALDRVNQLKPSRFNFIADADKTVDGFLAHEVQDIVPEAITGEKDAVDEEGNPVYQGIDQSKLVPLLVGAIKELKADNNSLRARIEILENN